jgi:Fructose-2,6-bisphosphatase
MDKISGLSYDELINIYGERYLQCRERWDFSPLGCESFSDFSKRIDIFFDRLIGEYGQTNCNIALVTHAGVIRYLAGKVVDISFSDRYSLKIDNSSVCVLSYDYKKGLQIEHWNYTPSL